MTTAKSKNYARVSKIKEINGNLQFALGQTNLIFRFAGETWKNAGTSERNKKKSAMFKAKTIFKEFKESLIKSYYAQAISAC